MLEIPTSKSAELCDNGIAIAEEVDVKVGVSAWLNIVEYRRIEGESDVY